VRRIVAEAGLKLSDPAPFAPQTTLANALLTPTRIYVRPILPILKANETIKGLAHITGGGFPDNLPRVLPNGLGIRVDLDAIPVPPVFRWLANLGPVSEPEMLRTFNCGISMALITAPASAAALEADLRATGEEPILLGEVVEGSHVTFAGRLVL
jgi:phosphoribosylformylglycinamidine cyclo-ligase